MLAHERNYALGVGAGFGDGAAEGGEFVDGAQGARGLGRQALGHQPGEGLVFLAFAIAEVAAEARGVKFVLGIVS